MRRAARILGKVVYWLAVLVVAVVILVLLIMLIESRDRSEVDEGRASASPPQTQALRTR